MESRSSSRVGCGRRRSGDPAALHAASRHRAREIRDRKRGTRMRKSWTGPLSLSRPFSEGGPVRPEATAHQHRPCLASLSRPPNSKVGRTSPSRTRKIVCREIGCPLHQFPLSDAIPKQPPAWWQAPRPVSCAMPISASPTTRFDVWIGAPYGRILGRDKINGLFWVGFDVFLQTRNVLVF